MKEAARSSAAPEDLRGIVDTSACVSTTMASYKRCIPAFMTRLSGMLFSRHMVGSGGSSDMGSLVKHYTQENWPKLECTHAFAKAQSQL
mmetsp:Transcript_35815/g.65718  ORF Transcript_35815/g.65718 Transcript_35815/m.65718 type:complete len:89 (-) Transcript_35815:21-287(-)